MSLPAASHPPALPRWRRAGLMLEPGLFGSGWSNHCQMPVPLMLDDRLRLYFTTRDRSNRAHIVFADLEPAPPWRRIALSNGPVVAPGAPGSFDAAGVMPTAVRQMGEEIWLYTIGWSVRADVPYHNAIGLMISRDGGTSFTHAVPGPVIGPGPYEPYFVGTGEVARIGDKWVMWYSSTTEWRQIAGRMEPRYHLKYATSEDGIHWRQDGRVALDYAHAAEGGIARATLLPTADRYAMWFCHRALQTYRGTGSGAYRIGSACSPDGFAWTRNAGSVFENAPDAFDTHMECYPSLLETENRLYLLYNGNDFGQTGIGYAEAIR